MVITPDYSQALHEKYAPTFLHLNYGNIAVQLNLKNLSLSNPVIPFHYGELV